MEIGVIGIESGHVGLYADALKPLYPSGIRIARAWCGDAPYKETALERILDADDLIESSDALIIALRYAMHHADHAVRCLGKGKPVFVDKPFALLIEDAKRMCEAAERTDTLLMGGSALCFLPEINELRKQAKQCRHASVRYWSDIFSPYGGWPFYGSHACDLCTAIFGSDFVSIQAIQSGGNIEAHVTYPNYTVYLSTTAKPRPPAVEIDGHITKLSEKGCFFYAMKEFTMSENRYDHDSQRLIASVHLMNSIFAGINAG